VTAVASLTGVSWTSV